MPVEASAIPTAFPTPKGPTTRADKWLSLCPKAETYPNRGGPDCPNKCEPFRKCYYTHFLLGEQLRNLSGWQNQMKTATAILREHGKVIGTNGMGTDPEKSMEFHLSFNYFCCYTYAEWHKIVHVMRSAVDWNALHEVKWDRVVCRTDSPPNQHVSFILLADAESNSRLQSWISQIEATVAKASGVPIHVPRAQQQPFHVTVGVVDAMTAYPIDAALQDINKRLLPRRWDSIVLPKRPDIFRFM